MNEIPLGDDLAGALAAVPQSAGVGQIVARDGKSLLLGRGANLRRWAAAQLGAGPPPRKGVRPRTNLLPVAGAIRFTATTSGFNRSLVFERLIAPLVPPSARRDLKPPGYLQLDPNHRFPRVTVRAGRDLAHAFGPFRDKAAAARAAAALLEQFPLRPCDFTFEPDPALALGLACLYAQVHSCPAPCLQRISEDHYRALAQAACGFLADPTARADAAWIRPFVTRADARALVVEAGAGGIELYPISAGVVLDEASLVVPAEEEVAAACRRLRWEPVPADRDDRAWLASWLYSRRSGRYLVPGAGAAADDVAQSVRGALAGCGDNVART